jgi:hypothetical protein
MMAAIRRWLSRPPTGRRTRPEPYYDTFFASPHAVEDDYRRLAGDRALPRVPFADCQEPLPRADESPFRRLPNSGPVCIRYGLSE